MVKCVLSVAVVFLVLAGCGHDPAKENADRAASLSVEDRIKKIQETPGLPDGEKAKLVEQLRSRPAAGHP